MKQHETTKTPELIIKTAQGEVYYIDDNYYLINEDGNRKKVMPIAYMTYPNGTEKAFSSIEYNNNLLKKLFRPTISGRVADGSGVYIWFTEEEIGTMQYENISPIDDSATRPKEINPSWLNYQTYDAWTVYLDPTTKKYYLWDDAEELIEVEPVAELKFVCSQEDAYRFMDEDDEAFDMDSLSESICCGEIDANPTYVWFDSKNETDKNKSKIYIGSASVTVHEDWKETRENKNCKGYRLPHLEGVYNNLDEFLAEVTDEFNIYEWSLKEESSPTVLYAYSSFEDKELAKPWNPENNEEYENKRMPIYAASFAFTVYSIVDYPFNLLLSHEKIEDDR